MDSPIRPGFIAFKVCPVHLGQLPLFNQKGVDGVLCFHKEALEFLHFSGISR
jgi:hypothetical protein